MVEASLHFVLLFTLRRRVLTLLHSENKILQKYMYVIARSGETLNRVYPRTVADYLHIVQNVFITEVIKLLQYDWMHVQSVFFSNLKPSSKSKKKYCKYMH